MNTDYVCDSRGHSFSMVDDPIVDIYLRKIKPDACAVYLVLIRHASPKLQTCYPSIARLMEFTGLAKPTVLKALKTLQSAGLITWEQRQREDGGMASNFYRLLPPGQSPLLPPVNLVYPPSQSPLLPPVNEIDSKYIHLEEDKKEEESTPLTPRQRGERAARFSTPTLSEVIAYFSEMGGTSRQAEPFHDYYTANGWRVGRAQMKDWKAAARNWLRRDKETPRTKPGKLTLEERLERNRKLCEED